MTVGVCTVAGVTGEAAEKSLGRPDGTFVSAGVTVGGGGAADDDDDDAVVGLDDVGWGNFLTTIVVVVIEPEERDDEDEGDDAGVEGFDAAGAATPLAAAFLRARSRRESSV